MIKMTGTAQGIRLSVGTSAGRLCLSWEDDSNNEIELSGVKIPGTVQKELINNIQKLGFRVKTVRLCGAKFSSRFAKEGSSELLQNDLLRIARKLAIAFD